MGDNISLVEVIKSLIENYRKNRNSNGITQCSKRVDILYALGKLSDEDYKSLQSLMRRSW